MQLKHASKGINILVSISHVSLRTLTLTSIYFPFSSISRNGFPLMSSKPSLLYSEHSTGIYFTCKRADYSTRNLMAISKGCAWGYTLLPNLNKMEFTYLNPLPAPNPVIRSLSIWKMMNERTVISNIHVSSAWVPGNWQAMWSFHPNYLLNISFSMLMCHCLHSDLLCQSIWLAFMASCLVFHLFASCPIFFWEIPRCPFYVHLVTLSLWPTKL